MLKLSWKIFKPNTLQYNTSASIKHSSQYPTEEQTGLFRLFYNFTENWKCCLYMWPHPGHVEVPNPHRSCAATPNLYPSVPQGNF